MLGWLGGKREDLVRCEDACGPRGLPVLEQRELCWHSLRTDQLLNWWEEHSFEDL